MNKKINVEQLFLAALGSKEKLKWYLKNDINLVEYLDVYFPKYLAATDLFLAFIPKKQIKEMLEDFTMLKILSLLAKNRYELHEIINTPEGLGWMRDQIDNFRKRFLG